MEELRNCYINWIHFVSPINTWTVFIASSSTASLKKFIAMSGIELDNVKRAISLNQRDKGVDKTPSDAKKRLLRKKFQQPFISALQKNKPKRTSGSVFAERIEKAKKTNFELDLTKFVDCYLDGHGS